MEPLPDSEVRSRALALAKEHFPDGTNPLITAIVSNVMDGYLVTVTFNSNTDKEEDMFVLVTREAARRFYDVEDMANSVSNFTLRKRTAWEVFWDTFGVHGVLAVVILSIIVFHSYKTQWAEDPPNYLVAAFSTVIGYYFGRFTKKEAPTG